MIIQIDLGNSMTPEKAALFAKGAITVLTPVVVALVKEINKRIDKKWLAAMTPVIVGAPGTSAELTSTVAVLPLLFLGALIMESFFGIPGLGSFTIDAINGQDFAVVRSMVFVGSLLYIIGLILTDISYTIADPRIRLS